MTGPAERAGELRRLWAAVRHDLTAAEAIADALGQVPDQPSLLEQAGVALNLHHFYSACEEALVRIGRAVDGADYRGGDWQRELLASMSQEIPGVRDAVISGETLHLLDAYRGFRHVVRHAYDYGLDWERIEPLLRRLPKAAAAFASDLHEFLDRLLQCANDLDRGGDEA